MKNEIILRFCIWDFNDITHEYITNSIGIQPTKEYIKGQKKNPNFPTVSKNNGWLMESGLSKYSSFDEQFDKILTIIENKIDVFKILCSKYKCEFSCGLYLYFDNNESAPSVHLNSRYNSVIKELNVDFDLDIYCLPNE